MTIFHRKWLKKKVNRKYVFAQQKKKLNDSCEIAKNLNVYCR